MYHDSAKQQLDTALIVGVVTGNPTLLQRLKSELEPLRRYRVEHIAGGLPAVMSTVQGGVTPALVVVELGAEVDRDIAELGRLLDTSEQRPAVIVVSDRLSAAAARALIKLHVADLLETDCSGEELRKACEHALATHTNSDPATIAYCVAFMSALGGAGATTLALETQGLFSREKNASPARLGIVDLNLQYSTVCDYLDLPPSLDIAEIAKAPERLDSQLLEIMLTRHKNGTALLAAPPSLPGHDDIAPEIVAQLLNVASTSFDRLVFDLPSSWAPWSESAVRGADRFFIVSDFSVAGLRHARHLGEMIGSRLGRDMTNSVIVNRSSMWSTGGVTKRHVRDILGVLLAGFLPDVGGALLETQNKGVPYYATKPKNALAKGLTRILAL